VPADAFTAETLDLLEGLVRAHPNDPDRVVLTRAGRLMANDIATRLR
jgi:hypothetical protein